MSIPMKKENPRKICQQYFLLLSHKLPIDIVRYIIQPNGSVLINEECILSIFIGELQKEITRRLQIMIDLFVDWRTNGIFPKKLLSILDPCSNYHDKYSEVIFSNPGKYLKVSCSIERDRCEIPILISPPIYDFPHAEISFVHNEIIRELNKNSNITNVIFWSSFLDELRTIITFGRSSVTMKLKNDSGSFYIT